MEYRFSDATRAGAFFMKPEDATEKRQTPRIHVPVYLETFSQSFPIGILTNLSTQGMFVQTTEPKEVGTRMELQFALPGKDRTVQVSAEVTRVNRPSTHPESQALAQPGRPVDDNPGMGLRILAVDPRCRSSLTKFIRSLHQPGKS